MVEYRLAKARVAGSNPVSCFFVAGISLCFKGFRLLSFIIIMAVFANGCMFIFAGFSRVMKFLVAISLWI